MFATCSLVIQNQKMADSITNNSSVLRSLKEHSEDFENFSSFNVTTKFLLT